MDITPIPLRPKNERTSTSHAGPDLHQGREWRGIAWLCQSFRGAASQGNPFVPQDVGHGPVVQAIGPISNGPP